MARLVQGQRLLAFRRRYEANLIAVAFLFHHGRNSHGFGDIEHAPDAFARLVARPSWLGGARPAGIAAGSVADILVGQPRGRNGRADAGLAPLSLEIVEGRPVARLGVFCGRQQQAPLRIILQERHGITAAQFRHGIAEPQLGAVQELGGILQAVIQLGTAADLHRFAGKVQIAVLDTGRGDVCVALGLDGGRFVGQQCRLPRRLAGAVQRAADPQVACRIDQRMLAVGQRAHAQVHVATRGDDGVGLVLQQRRLDADAVAINAPGVDQVAGGDAGVAAVDQAGVGQQAADDQFVVAHGDQFTARAVGERIRRYLQVLARVDLAIVVQVAGHEFQRCSRGQRAARVGQAGESQRGLGIGRHVATRVLERAGGQRQVLSGADTAGLIVDRTGVQGDLLAHQPEGPGSGAASARDTVGERVAVVQAVRVQGQGIVGLDQAAAVVEHPLCLERQAARGDDAAGIGQALRIQRRLALRGDGAADIVDGAVRIQIERAAGRDAPARVLQAARLQVGRTAIQTAALVAQRAGVVDGQLAIRLRHASAVVQAGRLDLGAAAQQLAAPIVQRTRRFDTQRAIGLDRSALIVDAGVAAQRHAVARNHSPRCVDQGFAADVDGARACQRAAGVVDHACHAALERAAAGELARGVVEVGGAQRHRAAIDGAAAIADRAAGVQRQ
ncbi:Uncharacterised protein [Achromobacter xylosoxidans]|nr:Uncharacterised protein [Achromobacter xylosoxidans]